MKFTVFSIVLFLCSSLLLSQNEALIDVDNFDQLLMENMLHKSINKVREDQNLPILSRLETLDAAAFDQAEYNQKNNKEGHDQADEDKKNVTLRVRSYGGLHYEMGELISNASIGIPIKFGSGKTTINTYEQAAKFAVENWLSDEDSRAIVQDQSYYSLGVAASFNEERKEIAFIAIMASPPFDLKGEKDRKDEYALNEYNKTVCDPFNRNNPFLAELLSDKISIENGIIYLDNSDRELLSEILADGRDGFAVDLVTADQFDCMNGNSLYPSNFHEGLLLRPIKGSTVNYKTPEGQYLSKFELGKLPSSYDPKTTNTNLLIFKDAVVCNYIPSNKTDAKNLHWIEPQWELMLSENTSGLVVNKTTFHSSQQIQIIDFLKSIPNDAKEVKSLEIIYNYSPLIVDSINTLTTEIKDAIPSNLKTHELKIENKYESINSFIANRPIALEIADLTEKEKLNILNETTDKELITYLDNNHKTQISYAIYQDLISFTNEELKKNYKSAIQNNRIESAITFQSELIKRGRNGDKAAVDALSNNEIDQTKSNLTLISNTEVLKVILSEKTNLAERENLRRTFLGLYLVDKTNEIVAYNLCLSILYAWELGKKAPVTPEKWEEYYQSASANGIINTEKLKRLSTNFNLLSADYYYDKGNIRERKKSLEAAYENIISSENSAKEAIMYAQYFMFQLQINWATTVLLNNLKVEFNLEVAKQLISLSSYPSAEISSQKTEQLLLQINEADHSDFCNLFNSNKAHYLYLKSDIVKKIWCRDCKN